MSLFRFDLITDRPLTNENRDQLPEAVGRGVQPVDWNGAPAFTCAVEADSLPEAVLATVQGLHDLGIEVLTVQVAPSVFVA